MGPQDGGIVNVPASPDDDELQSLHSLLTTLGRDVGPGVHLGVTLEECAEDYLHHDTSVNAVEWFADQDEPGHLILEAEGVVMWLLDFPMTLAQFHEYLDELDRRIMHQRILVEMPAPEDEEDDENWAESINTAIAGLFGVDVGLVSRSLGAAWTPLQCDVVGTQSQPSKYACWADSIVLGVDDQYGYLFRLDADGKVLDAYGGGVVCEIVWTDDGAIPNYSEFLQILRGAVASTRPKPLPRKRT